MLWNGQKNVPHHRFCIWDIFDTGRAKPGYQGIALSHTSESNVLVNKIQIAKKNQSIWYSRCCGMDERMCHINTFQNHVISVMWHRHMILWKSCGQYFKSFQNRKLM